MVIKLQLNYYSFSSVSIRDSLQTHLYKIITSIKDEIRVG